MGLALDIMGEEAVTEVVPTTINDRWTILLPAHRADRLEWPIWERERLAAMRDVIGPGDVVYDIGAEEGDFPALWAKWGADVVLVEPNPRVWPNIRLVFEANNLTGRVRGWFVGFAGDAERRSLAPWVRADEDEIARWPRCAWGEVIGDHGFLALPENPHMPVTTIDALAGRHGPPTVVTIDVEGAELTVLRGAAHTLTDVKPRVFVSIHLDLPWVDEKYPGDTEDRVYEWMDSFGYVGVELAVDHEKHVEFRHPDGR